MNKTQLLAFFKQVASVTVPKRPTGAKYLSGGGGDVYRYDLDGAVQWVTNARTALASLLPPSHPIYLQFETYSKQGIEEERQFERMQSTFRAATTLLENDQLSSLADGIRAETGSELLDQAEQLLSSNHMVAAAVLAGGALETHLHGLCVKHGLTWMGDGSIAKYDGVIAQTRNSGHEIYSALDTKSIAAWGGLRNEAAHKPTAFSASAERVRMMIDGIRLHRTHYVSIEKRAESRHQAARARGGSVTTHAGRGNGSSTQPSW